MMHNLHNSKGVALFITLALMFLISALVITVLLTIYNYTYITDTQIKRLKALTLVEAGINRAYFALRINPAYSGESITIAAGENPVTITIEGSLPLLKIKSRTTY